MPSDEILKAVFPLLDGADLAACMAVCKQWHEVAQDDYFWQCLCAKKWPSVCKRQSPPTVTYCKIFRTFYKREKRKSLLPPRITLSDLEFYIDIWADETLIFSEALPGPVFRNGNRVPPPGTCKAIKYHFDGPEFKLNLLVEPRFTVPMTQTDVSVSIFVMRKDSNKIACIIHKSEFDYIDRTSFRALAYDYLDFSPAYPFVSGIRAWFSLLFMDHATEGVLDVFGIEIDFCDAASSEREVLWLMDMLDWK